MTQTFGVNENNDLFIGSDGNLSIVSGQQAVLFACASAAKAQLGEMIYAVNQGIPNFQAVWVGTPNLQQFEAALRNTLLNVSGVVQVDSITFTQTNTSKGNILGYTAVIVTEYGETILNGKL